MILLDCRRRRHAALTCQEVFDQNVGYVDWCAQCDSPSPVMRRFLDWAKTARGSIVRVLIDGVVHLDQWGCPSWSFHDQIVWSSTTTVALLGMVIELVQAGTGER